MTVNRRGALRSALWSSTAGVVLGLTALSPPTATHLRAEEPGIPGPLLALGPRRGISRFFGARSSAPPPASADLFAPESANESYTSDPAAASNGMMSRVLGTQMDPNQLRALRAQARYFRRNPYAMQMWMLYRQQLLMQQAYGEEWVEEGEEGWESPPQHPDGELEWAEEGPRWADEPQRSTAAAPTSSAPAPASPKAWWETGAPPPGGRPRRITGDDLTAESDVAAAPSLSAEPAVPPSPVPAEPPLSDSSPPPLASEVSSESRPRPAQPVDDWFIAFPDDPQPAATSTPAQAPTTPAQVPTAPPGANPPQTPATAPPTGNPVTPRPAALPSRSPAEHPTPPAPLPVVEASSATPPVVPPEPEQFGPLPGAGGPRSAPGLTPQALPTSPSEAAVPPPPESPTPSPAPMSGSGDSSPPPTSTPATETAPSRDANLSPNNAPATPEPAPPRTDPAATTPPEPFVPEEPLPPSPEARSTPAGNDPPREPAEFPPVAPSASPSAPTSDSSPRAEPSPFPWEPVPAATTPTPAAVEPLPGTVEQNPRTPAPAAVIPPAPVEAAPTEPSPLKDRAPAPTPAAEPRPATSQRGTSSSDSGEPMPGDSPFTGRKLSDPDDLPTAPAADEPEWRVLNPDSPSTPPSPPSERAGEKGVAPQAPSGAEAPFIPEAPLPPRSATPDRGPTGRPAPFVPEEPFVPGGSRTLDAPPPPEAEQPLEIPDAPPAEERVPRLPEGTSDRSGSTSRTPLIPPTIAPSPLDLPEGPSPGRKPSLGARTSPASPPPANAFIPPAPEELGLPTEAPENYYLPPASPPPTGTSRSPLDAIEDPVFPPDPPATLRAPDPIVAPSTARRIEIPPQPTPQETQEKLARIAARKGLDGLKGFCPVVLRDERNLVDARPEFSAVYNGRRYYFSSAAAQALFEAAPERYAPAASGFDVVHLSLTGEQTRGSLDFAVWFRGRLYLFTSAETMETFVAAPSIHAAAD